MQKRRWNPRDLRFRILCGYFLSIVLELVASRTTTGFGYSTWAFTPSSSFTTTSTTTAKFRSMNFMMAASSTREDFISIGRQSFAPYYTFPLDHWQLEAGGALIQGRNVIVCAPTGAGKTVVGEMALLHAYHNLQAKGIYTTPLKALSNQKYADLIPIFGIQQVGLSTGDMSIRKGSPITVMTTEVYRNLAWRNELSDTAVVVLDEFHYMGNPGRGGVWEESVITSPSHVQMVALSATLSNAAALAQWMEAVTQRSTVLVQVDAQRRPVPLRYLFANKEGLFPLFRDPDAGPGAPKGLLGLRGDGVVVDPTSNKGFGSDASVTDKLPRGLQLNPALKKAAELRLQRVSRALERQRHQSYASSHDDELGVQRRRTSYGRMSPREERKERERLLKRELRRSMPSLAAVINRLQQKELLPAIFFIFSRAGCDEAARNVYQTMKGPRDPNRLLVEEVLDFREIETEQRKRKTRQRGRRRGDLIEDGDGRVFRSQSSYVNEDVLSSIYEPHDKLDVDRVDETSPLSADNWDFYSKAGLLHYDQIRNVASRISVFNEKNPEIAFDDEIAEQYLFGVGSHHAGMLPAHKSFVEVLYRNQLMKVVFATETLAAGINMPARTTVVCALAKRGDGSSMNLLETSNLLQMAGRAGRRGMDTDGTCVIVATPFETHDDAAKILTDPIKPISSQFSPSYSLAVNLITRGDGKLDVARQLVGKSFAMWEKRQQEESVESTVERNGETVSEILQGSAQQRFMNVLIDCLQVQVDSRRAKFDIARLESLLAVITDKEQLKKTSKAFAAASKMLELEVTTLGYLEQEYLEMNQLESDELLQDIMRDDENELVNQIEVQRKRALVTEKDLNKHPFQVLAEVANAIMEENTPEASVLLNALRSARKEVKPSESLNLTASELCSFSKSAIVVGRRARKLATANPELDPSTVLEHAENAVASREDSWNDMLAITRTLFAYGCITTDHVIDLDCDDLESLTFALTSAGENLALLGFENSLWTLVAVGGAWDVTSASSRLDRFRDALGTNDIDWYEEERNGIPKPQEEAQKLVEQLRSLPADELAGYVSCLASETARTGGPSIVDLFQRLSPDQQRVIQSALVSMERLTEVQNRYSVGESVRRCSLDITNCEVVTAWAGGCSWTEALQISGLPPGDLVRILSRALDALRQLGNLQYAPIRKPQESEILTASPGIQADVRRLCRDAAKMINRYPVKDTLTFETYDNEEDDSVQDDFDGEP